MNRRVFEQLADQLDTLELANQSPSQLWTYRKAAWAIEDLDQDLGLIQTTMGKHGLESIPGIGSTLAGEIGDLILKARQTPLD